MPASPPPGYTFVPGAAIQDTAIQDTAIQDDADRDTSWVPSQRAHLGTGTGATHSDRPPAPQPAAPARSDATATGRVSIDGRHLRRGGRPFRARGVTYGSFAPRDDGAAFPETAQLRSDLAAIADLGFTAIRTYTLPPTDLLDAAAELGLVVHAGLHYADWRSVDGIGRRAARQVLDGGLRAVDEALERLAGRPEVLAVSVGNEVPTDLVRLHGVGSVERTLGRLVAALHDGDADLSVSYGTYPSTEYLQVPELDLATVNVFLDDPTDLRRYLRHLAVAVGDVPLLIGELGVQVGTRADEVGQATRLSAQLDEIDAAGLAGAFVFSWTDDWVVGGERVEQWRFGLTDTDRRPRPAATAAGQWARRSLRETQVDWPSLSVVVCAYNEVLNLDRCLTSLAAVDYPGLEVLVVDDGSTDATLQIAARYPFRVLALPHGGLSVARNAGARAASGAIVAYLDADAACHPEWPYHLALAMTGPHAGPDVVAAGGPNLARSEAGLVERAVAASPGNPVEVLSGPDRAEHVPGCNCAVRRDVLLAGDGEGNGDTDSAAVGFRHEFTAAGDDVDLFWRLLDGGGHIAFSPAAQVVHARRSTVGGFLRQQRGYGRAERMVSGRHPHRFNRSGQAVWAGSLYGGASWLPGRSRRGPIDFGPAGSGAYQPRLAHRSRLAGLADQLPTRLPALLAVATTGAAGAFVTPFALLPAAAALLLVLGYATTAALGCRPSRREVSPLRFRLLVGLLHLLQPLARARGRQATQPLPMPARPRAAAGDRAGWVDALHVALAGGTAVRRGPSTDRHDLTVGLNGFVRVQLTTGLAWGARPLLRRRWRPGRTTVTALGVTLLAGPVSPLAALVVAGATAVGIVGETVVLHHRVVAAAAATRPEVSR